MSERSSPGKALQAEGTAGASPMCLKLGGRGRGKGLWPSCTREGEGGPMSGPDCTELCKAGKGIYISIKHR